MSRDEITGRLELRDGMTAARYRIGRDTGEVFSEGDDFDGCTLTIEITDPSHGERLLRAISDGGAGPTKTRARTDARRCPVPDCGRALYPGNIIGVCRTHTHAAGYCRCGRCNGSSPAIQKEWRVPGLPTPPWEETIDG